MRFGDDDKDSMFNVMRLAMSKRKNILLECVPAHRVIRLYGGY